MAEETVDQLRKEVAILRTELDQLKNKDNINVQTTKDMRLGKHHADEEHEIDQHKNKGNIGTQTQKNFDAIAYQTDEEQLEWETTNYPRGRQRKKRKAESSPETTPQDANKLELQTKKKETGRPPPIVMTSVINYETLCNSLKEQNINFETMMLAGEEVKINVEKETEYKEVTKILNEKRMEWYSFEDGDLPK